MQQQIIKIMKKNTKTAGNKDFPLKLLIAMKRVGINSKQLASELGWKAPEISDYLRGARKRPHIDRAIKLVEFFEGKLTMRDIGYEFQKSTKAEEGQLG